MYGPRQPIPSELIVDFQEDLKTLSAEQIYELPDLTPEISHTSAYVRLGSEAVKGAHLDTGDSDRQGIYDPSVQFAFQSQPSHRLTREDSHNAVFFGRLWMLPEDERIERHAQVAIKSMPTKDKDKLFGEAALFQHIGNLGLETYDVAGLVVGEKSTHLMTYFKGRVATMDTVEWSEATPDEAWFELEKAVDTAYKLHTNMLFHGDLVFRNVAFDETGQVVIIDPELMTSPRNDMELLMNSGIMLDEEKQRILGKLVRRMSHEFSEICKSIDEHIIPVIPKAQRPRGCEARLKLYKRHLFEPYRNKIRETEEPLRSLLLRIFDEMMLRKKADAAAERL